jgi:hypothetical protein
MKLKASGNGPRESGRDALQSRAKSLKLHRLLRDRHRIVEKKPKNQGAHYKQTVVRAEVLLARPRMGLSVCVVGNKLCFATDQAADSVEFGLFFWSEDVSVLASCIECGVRAAKLLIGVGGD